MNEDETRTYALKCLKKAHIVETKQEEHIMNEKRIMSEATNSFIVKLVLVCYINKTKWTELKN